MKVGASGVLPASPIEDFLRIFGVQAPFPFRISLFYCGNALSLPRLAVAV
jgi:hypothetical protein